MSVTYVKDYQGKLIPKAKARRIKDESGEFAYYEENISCVLMPDDTWYRTTTGKIVYDWSLKKWVFCKDFQGVTGLVEDGSFGSYSNRDQEVSIMFKKDTFLRKSVFDPMSRNLVNKEFQEKRWNKSTAINEATALSYGYKEAISDGNFYKEADIIEEEKIKLNTPSIPNGERTNTYSLDDDKEYRAILEDFYDKNEIKVPRELALIAKHIPFTWGVEIEIQNGFIPKRIREPLGFRTCRDGSLDTGQEYVGIPMQGGKGLATLKKMCEELTKRCVISNKCSVHLHFGEVRRDKIYILSLWTLFTKIQEEFRKYFPYSRTNTIRDDGKIYAALLPVLDLKLDNLLATKDDETFKAKILSGFNSIYTYLNHGHPLGEAYDEKLVKETRTEIINGKPQQQYCYRVKKFNYSTKLPRHAIQGRKWERRERYLAMNILNLFFSHSRTIEMRIHEASTNFDKILMFMLLSVAIIKYAEKFSITFKKKEITIKEILEKTFPGKISSQVLAYLEARKFTFCTVNGAFKSSWKTIEDRWYEDDRNFKLQSLL